MLRVLRWVGVALLLGAVGFAALFVGARFHDGPIGPFKGGPFRAGEPAPAPADWSVDTAANTLELEVSGAGVSVTTWLAVLDGALFVPCGLCESKRWAQEVLRDGDVRVRLDGKLYALRATRVLDPATLARVAPVLADKYHSRPEAFLDRTWLFALAPR